MAVQQTNTFNGRSLNSGAIGIAALHASFYDLWLVQFNPENDAGNLLIKGVVGNGSALTGFRVTWGNYVGAYAAGQHTTMAQNTDFNTTSNVVLEATSNLYLTAANGLFDLFLGVIPAEFCFGIECAAPTSLTLILQQIDI